MPRVRASAKIALSALGIALALAPARAQAEAPPPLAPVTSPPDVYTPLAESLFRDGLRAFDAGDFDAACAALTESLQLDPKLGTLLNVALCHEKQGRTAAAWLEYAHAAAWAAALGQADRRDFAVEHGAALEHRLFRVRLVLPPEPTLVVEVDGQSLPSAQLALPLVLDPGDHELRVSAPGRRPYQTALHVLPGPNAVDVRVPPLEPLAVPPPLMQPVPVAPPPDRTRLPGIVLGAAGVVALGVGTVLGVHSIATLDGVDTCAGTGCASHLRDQARSSEIGSLVAFGVGTVAIGAGLALWLRGPKRSVPATTTFLLRPVGSGAELGMSHAW